MFNRMKEWVTLQKESYRYAKECDKDCTFYPSIYGVDRIVVVQAKTVIHLSELFPDRIKEKQLRYAKQVIEAAEIKEMAVQKLQSQAFMEHANNFTFDKDLSLH